MCTKFAVDCSSRFSFRARTHTDTKLLRSAISYYIITLWLVHCGEGGVTVATSKKPTTCTLPSDVITHNPIHNDHLNSVNLPASISGIPSHKSGDGNIDPQSTLWRRPCPCSCAPSERATFWLQVRHRTHCTTVPLTIHQYTLHEGSLRNSRPKREEPRSEVEY